ncbi:tRNA (adenine(22)-N(1))-methyltransferase [Lachnobacterium bovis]|uniref:tRNA (Adenine22-N1)-methyltransferase n=1 Tax=Lachnobacterium bovis TaxID=140626 RepID=A0A1H9S352_9FIRM|nr:class I SAM-dependent methyltransferase [Lachnobacterium bovis]SER79358.1 tRNA (adenine22-N1)-methyltransferase [Lachnobacterium bovis]
MLKLSKRMRAVAAMVTPGNILADVGTDHGYVPIALIQREKIPKAIAVDINEGPLKRANENINLYGMQDSIETRISDGVEALKVNEVDSILIAGMGGELTIHILTEGEEICRNAKELILQPQSEVRKVRQYLRVNRYKIVDEDMILEDGKYYPIIKAIPVDQDDFWLDKNENVITTCDIYGPLLLKNGNPVLRKFLVHQYRKLTFILQSLVLQQDSESVRKRKQEVSREIHYNESAYSILGAIKNAGN